MAEPPGTRDVFTEWFTLADADKDDRVSGQEAVSFFTKFDQLVKKDLIECWEIADEYKRGFLTLREFKVAMGVVSLKQAGVREITAAHVQLLRSGETRGLPTPVLKSGERLGESPSVVGGGAPSSSSSGGNEAAAANGAMEQRQEQQQQQKEVAATTTTMTSGRPMLSDDIFAAYDQPPPPQTSGGGFDGFNAAGGAGFDGGFTASGPSVSSFSNDAFGSAPSSSAAPAGFHAHPSTSSDFSSGFDSNFQPPPSSQAFAPAAQVPPTVGMHAASQTWPAMGPSDYQRYQIQFLQSTNNDPNASIPAQVCAPMIAASGLEKQVLKQVWEIADARKIGALAWPEFVVGMYLAEVIKTRGMQCPEVMPPLPFPPFDQDAAGLLTNVAPSFSMAPNTAAAAAGAAPQQQQQQQQQMFAGVQAPVAQPDTFSFIPGSQLRDEFNTVSATASTTSHTSDASFTFRGPQLDLSAVPEAERQFAETQLNAAKQADENLFRQENRETENKMSAKAAQEALGNLALFRRKCEANLAEAENKASVAESEANELKKKVEEAKKMCEELIQKSERDDDDSIAKRLEKAREERDALRAQLEEENAKLRELSGNSASSASNTAEMEREIENAERDVAKLKNDIALAQKRLQVANERADLTTQLANVSMAAEKKEREQPPPPPPPPPPQPSAMTPNGSWGGVQIPPLPPMPTPAPPTPDAAKVGFDQWNEWNTTKTPPVAAKPRQQPQLQDDLFSNSPPVIPPAAVHTKPTQKQQESKTTDSFDFSAPTPRDFAPPAVAAALYSQGSSGGFFSDDETTPNHSRNPSGLDGINFTNTNTTATGGESSVPALFNLQQQNGVAPAPTSSNVVKTPENFVDPFADGDEVEDSFDDPFA